MTAAEAVFMGSFCAQPATGTDGAGDTGVDGRSFWQKHLFAASVYNGANLRDALAKLGKRISGTFNDLDG